MTLTFRRNGKCILGSTGEIERIWKIIALSVRLLLRSSVLIVGGITAEGVAELSVLLALKTRKESRKPILQSMIFAINVTLI